MLQYTVKTFHFCEIAPKEELNVYLLIRLFFSTQYKWFAFKIFVIWQSNSSIKKGKKTKNRETEDMAHKLHWQH